MPRVNEHPHFLLLQFLNERGDWVKGNRIAEKLQVTERTVRNYVRSINAHVQIPRVISGEQGYRINPDQDRLSLDRYMNSFTQLVPINRVNEVLRRLCLANDEGLDVAQLEDELFVSSSTIESDLQNVKSTLKNSGLQLVRKDMRIVLIADETQRRKIMTRIFYDEKNQHFISIEMLEETFGLKLQSFHHAMRAILDEHGIYLNDFALGSILVHIMVSVQRIRLSQGLDQQASLDPVMNSEILASQRLAQLIQAEFGVEFNLAEQRCLAGLLVSRNNPSGYTKINRETDHSAQSILDEIIVSVERDYLISLDDPVFLERFRVHLSNLILRMSMNSLNLNPLTGTIKSMYPLTYDLSVHIAQIIANRLNQPMTEDEIAFIAYHIAVFLEPRKDNKRRLRVLLVSPSFHELQHNLEKKILFEFGHVIEHLDLHSALDFSMESVHYDLILSTIPLNALRDPWILIAPILRQADIERIGQAITAIRDQSTLGDSRAMLMNMFTPELFERNPGYRNEWEAINGISQRLIELGYVPETFPEHLLEREKLSSTCFNGLIAVPHTMKMEAYRSSIAVVMLDTPMQWGVSSVQLITLVAVNRDDKKQFIDVFDRFIDVVSEPDHVRALLRNQTLDEFTSCLSLLMNQS
jgi:lichenan operon transcriptional antiterminator